MRFRWCLFSLFCIYLLLVIFSYGFVDVNFPLKLPGNLPALFFRRRQLVTPFFALLVGSLFLQYLYCLKQAQNKLLKGKQLWLLIVASVILLFCSWPGFSNDIFNYMATAKVTYFYKENPYLTMPIEFIGEPMLKFMHAANKTALYAPFWIILSAIPHFLGQGNLLLTVFTFKFFITIFYLACCWLIWKITKKNLYSLVFFSLNPLVVFESLITAHNDVVMMCFVLVAIYYVFQNKKIFTWLAFLVSVGIKYATLPLVPLFILVNRLKKEKLINYACWLMFLVFLLSPLREEIYPWYFIWVISLTALIPQNRLLRLLVFTFTLSLLLRYVPYLYFRTYKGLTQPFKTIVTLIIPFLVLSLSQIKKIKENF